MRSPATRIGMFVFGLAAVAALPLVFGAFRAAPGARCDFDGVAIEPARRVGFVEREGGRRQFCCVDCAERWIERSRRVPTDITVTDESTGGDVRADDAWFVRSAVTSFATTGSHIHVFAREAEARRHAEAFRGSILEGDERPFQGRE